MRKHIQYAVLGTVMAGALLWTGAASAAEPLDFLKGKVERLQTLLRKQTVEGSAAHERKRKALRKLLRSMINYADLSKQSLSRHWVARSPAERKEFVALLKQLIEDRVLSNINAHTEFSVEYQAPEQQGSKAVIKTVVRVPGKPEIEVEYKMARRGTAWRVWDLVTDGTSLVRNYRSQFNKIIGRDGYPALLEKMRDKLRKQESSGKVADAQHAG